MKLKKFLSAFLAAALICASATPGFAAEQSGKAEVDAAARELKSEAQGLYYKLVFDGNGKKNNGFWSRSTQNRVTELYFSINEKSYFSLDEINEDVEKLNELKRAAAVSAEELEKTVELLSRESDKISYYDEKIQDEFKTVYDECLKALDSTDDEAVYIAYVKARNLFDRLCLYNKRMGDVNNDGSVNVKDVTLLQLAVVEAVPLTYSQIFAAGYVTESDTSLLPNVKIVTDLQKFAVEDSSVQNRFNNSRIKALESKPAFELYPENRIDCFGKADSENANYLYSALAQSGTTAKSGDDIVLPDFLTDEYNDTLQKVQALSNENTFSIGFITDLHFYAADKNSIKTAGVLRACDALEKLSYDCSLNSVVFGGDYTQSTVETEDRQNGIDNLLLVNEIADRMNCPTFALAGNHEFKFSGYSDNGLTEDEVFSCLTQNYPSPKISQACDTVFYSIDDKDELCSIYIFEGDQDKYYADKVTYGLPQNMTDGIDRAIEANKNKYPVMIFCHYGIYFKTAEDGTAVPTRMGFADKIIDRINANDVGVIAWISGHIHSDWDLRYKGVPIITTAQAGLYSSKQSQDGVTYNHTINTAEESAFTVITVDREKQKIYLTRFGSGNDRELDFDISAYPVVKE